MMKSLLVFLLLTLALSGCSNTIDMQYPKAFEDATAQCLPRGGFGYEYFTVRVAQGREKLSYSVACKDGTVITRTLDMED